MKVLSLYSGADNLGDGVIQAGHQIVLCVEKDKDCCETIKLNHPDIEVINGLVSDNLSTLPKVDCVIGGPPCQDFSPAKIDRTFDLCEINNFRKAIEICKAEYHFMENVPDLMKVYKEKNFIINCADYGVPQIRLRRIFTNLSLPQPTHSNYPTETFDGGRLKQWVSVREALNLDGVILDCKYKHHERKSGINSTDKPSKTIDTQSRELFIEDRKTTFGEKEFRKYSINNPSHTLVVDAREFFNGRPLTLKELAILQGFRKDFKFYGNKNSIKKQIGNALPAAISKAFFTPMILAQQNHSTVERE